jgi:F-type H+-transporting ATPase subunit delta
MAERIESESRAGEEGSSERRLATVYAEALLDVADQRGQADEIGQELETIVREVLAQSPEVERTFASPVVRRTVKEKLIADAFQGKVSDLMFNFLHVLNSKDRLSLVRHVAAAYRDLLDQRAKRLRVKVRSAVPLSESQSERLRQEIAQATGLEPVIAARIDPELLGGMIVQIGDRVFDSSVRTRIETIRNQLLARSSYEIQTGRDRFSSPA